MQAPCLLDQHRSLRHRSCIERSNSFVAFPKSSGSCIRPENDLALVLLASAASTTSNPGSVGGPRPIVILLVVMLIILGGVPIIK